MSAPDDLRLARVKRLARHPTDVWQGAVVRMPQWLTEDGKPPVRPMLPLWVSRSTRMAHAGDVLGPENPDGSVLWDAFLDLAARKEIHYRPTAVEVVDPGLAALLRERLAGTDIDVRLTERAELCEGLMRQWAEKLGPYANSGLLDAPDVTLERVHAFADAAAAFYRAAPWNHLIGEDLIVVQSGAPEEGLSCFTVMGAGAQEFGLGFYRSREDFEGMMEAEDQRAYFRKHGKWMITFGPITELSLADSDLWLDKALPVAAENAYPLIAWFQLRGGMRRPDTEVLSFAEGLLRALADTTEDDLDSGRWSPSVATFDGERSFELSLPYLLEPQEADAALPGALTRPFDARLMDRAMLDLHRLLEGKELTSIEDMNRLIQEQQAKGGIPHREARTPLERAQDLVFEALDASGRRRIKLAREALRISPECADAWILLAEQMPDLMKRAERYHQGMQAGERSLGSRFFKKVAGSFWGHIEARPYMRARLAYAESLEAIGRRDEAITHYRDLLRLNPGDNQGVRFFLLPCLIEAGRDQEARELLREFDEDPSAALLYARALLEFRREGAGSEAARALDLAIETNPHVPGYLLGRKPLPKASPPHYGFGDEDEAVICAQGTIGAWTQTPGALDWLHAHRRERRKGKTGPKARKKK